MDEELKTFLPLSTATLYILLSLVGSPRRGYGIMQEVVRQSAGTYRMGPGTLYDNLQKLMDGGAVRELRARGENTRRRRYELTDLGQRVLAADMDRLRSLVREGSSRLRALSARRAR